MQKMTMRGLRWSLLDSDYDDEDDGNREKYFEGKGDGDGNAGG